MQKLAEICVRRPVFATMLILSLTVVGVFSFFSLGVDLFPKIDFPTITVAVVNPGASPQEVRDKVNLIRGQLPETAEDPIIQRVDTDAAPVVRIAVSAPRSLRDVTD